MAYSIEHDGLDIDIQSRSGLVISKILHASERVFRIAHCSYDVMMDEAADGYLAVRGAVHRVILRHEPTVLKYMIVPPRVVSSVYEAEMARQLVMQGHIDQQVLVGWSMSKVVSSVPYACALVPETRSRTLVGRALRAFGRLVWHPQEALPEYTGRMVRRLEDLYGLMERVWDNPGEVLDDGMEMVCDHSIRVVGRMYRVAEQGVVMVAEGMDTRHVGEVYVAPGGVGKGVGLRKCSGD